MANIHSMTLLDLSKDQRELLFELARRAYTRKYVRNKAAIPVESLDFPEPIISFCLTNRLIVHNPDGRYTLTPYGWVYVRLMAEPEDLRTKYEPPTDMELGLLIKLVLPLNKRAEWYDPDSQLLQSCQAKGFIYFQRRQPGRGTRSERGHEVEDAFLTNQGAELVKLWMYGTRGRPTTFPGQPITPGVDPPSGV
jgi:hypothetical protein